MKEQLTLLFLLIGSTCAALGRVRAPLAEIGTSTQFRNEDGLGNYNFGYDEDHTSGGSFRRETGTALGAKEGSYGLRDADGRVRVVSYVADELGFRASISTNEPGTMPSTPAGVNIGVPQQGPVAPAVPVAAPAPAAPALAAPTLAAPAPAAYASPTRVAFNAAPARRPTYTPQEPVVTFFQGAPTPLDIKSAPVGPQSYGVPSPLDIKSAPVGPASYGGLAAALFGASPLAPAAHPAPAPWSGVYSGPVQSPAAPGAYRPPPPATYNASPLAPAAYGPSLPATSPFGAPAAPFLGAPLAMPVGHHYVYRQDNFVTLPADGRPYPTHPAPHAYPSPYSSPHAGPVAHVTTSHAYSHKIAHSLGGGHHRSYTAY
ncbi:uncharacterized protein LOC119396272 [Rhipicephalus sanguineus]|uniref:Cuticular protein n=1 Tax=Rhipicephalus sanguineus TaxID=34632 RepID=A0A9D4PPY4_RHISA|nr:uncharacterized protein LOC119396272 [Rhipicephalus sanguineus]KAH7948535.1 hypothetical protein HPB52_024099 [Rhipicephalus sanguineus]